MNAPLHPKLFDFNHVVTASDNGNAWYPISRLCAIFGVRTSAQVVNKLLERYGYLRKVDGKYRMTVNSIAFTRSKHNNIEFHIGAMPIVNMVLTHFYES